MARKQSAEENEHLEVFRQLKETFKAYLDAEIGSGGACINRDSQRQVFYIFHPDKGEVTIPAAEYNELKDAVGEPCVACGGSLVADFDQNWKPQVCLVCNDCRRKHVLIESSPSLLAD